MNFNPFISLIRNLYGNQCSIMIWHQDTLFSNLNQAIKQENLKPLIFKLVNGNGNYGTLPLSHHLIQELDFQQKMHYFFIHVDQTSLILFNSNVIEQVQFEYLFRYEYQQLRQNQQIKGFIQRKFENQRNTQASKKQNEAYFIQLIIESITRIFPLIKQEQVKFDEELLKKWIDKGINLDVILSSIEEFIELSKALELSLFNYTIVEDDLNLSVKPLIKPTLSIKAEKVNLLLNRYEKAAEMLQSLNLEINGKNIALYLEPPVSPAAITDALKKNRKKIISLLLENPNNWKLIRNNLKSLRDIETIFN